jgi:hypothetical protein
MMVREREREGLQGARIEASGSCERRDVSVSVSIRVRVLCGRDRVTPNAHSDHGRSECESDQQHRCSMHQHQTHRAAAQQNDIDECIPLEEHGAVPRRRRAAANHILSFSVSTASR